MIGVLLVLWLVAAPALGEESARVRVESGPVQATVALEPVEPLSRVAAR